MKTISKILIFGGILSYYKDELMVKVRNTQSNVSTWTSHVLETDFFEKGEKGNTGLSCMKVNPKPEIEDEIEKIETWGRGVFFDNTLDFKYRLPGESDLAFKMLKNNNIYDACRRGNTTYLRNMYLNKLMVEDLDHHKFVFDNCFSVASSNDYVDIVQLLSSNEKIDQKVLDDSFKKSIRCGSSKVTKLLLSKINPPSDSIINASESGRIEIIKLLLDDGRVDPSAWNNKAIHYCSVSNNLAIVRLLLNDPRVDINKCGNSIITTAVKSGNPGIVKEILKYPQVDPSINDNMLLKTAYSVSQDRFGDDKRHLETIISLL